MINMGTATNLKAKRLLLIVGNHLVYFHYFAISVTKLAECTHFVDGNFGRIFSK